VFEGQATVAGPEVGNLIGLKDVRATLAMLRTPGGHGGIELDKFHTPEPVRFGPVNAPVNALGLRRIMFAVEGIDEAIARMRRHGAELIGEMRYGDTYRLAYIRGPEGIIVGLAEEIPPAAPRAGKAKARPKAASRAKGPSQDQTAGGKTARGKSASRGKSAARGKSASRGKSAAQGEAAPGKGTARAKSAGRRKSAR
jgi:hypothetical protein